MVLSKNKKAQGLSLNVIIIAALALIVLVVLVAIFLGKAGETDQTVSKFSGPSKLELEALKLKYADCHPTEAAEEEFMKLYSDADDADGEQSAKQNLKQKIDDCKTIGDTEAACPAGCIWD